MSMWNSVLQALLTCTVWHKILTVENIDESGVGKILTSKKLTNANEFIKLSF